MSDLPPPPSSNDQPPGQPWGVQQPAPPQWPPSPGPQWGPQPGPVAWSSNMVGFQVNPFDSRGTTVLVLGILGLVVCQVLGPIAWVMGSNVRRDALASGYPVPGNATAGRILGIIATALIALTIGFIVVVLIAAAASTN